MTRKSFLGTGLEYLYSKSGQTVWPFVKEHLNRDIMKSSLTLLIALLVLPGSASAADTYGYAKDENGRQYQTRFDLRKRWFWGGAASFDGDLTANLQTGAVYEEFDEWENHRDRQAFLEATLQMSTLELDATLYRWDRSRRSEEPPVWITTFIGEPRRFDVPLHLGPSIVLGRVARREFDTSTQTRIDVGEAGFHWTLAQSNTLEDFVRIRLAAAGGVNIRTAPDEVYGYFAPSASLEGRWSPSDRGLWEISFDATARRGFEPSGINWTSLSSTLEVERVLFAINDQPLTVFIQGRAEAFNNVDDRRFWGLAGARINFFVPPPLPPDQCPNEKEDFDGFEDDDGCADPDNDGDGIRDSEDNCPFESGLRIRHGCPISEAPYDPDPCVRDPNGSRCLSCKLDPTLPTCPPAEEPVAAEPPNACESSPEGCTDEN